MTPRKAWLAGLAGVALVSPATVPVRAQDLPPALGSAAAGAGAGASGLGGLGSLAGGAGGLGGLTGAASAAQPQSLLGFLGFSKANCAACKAAFCQSQLGQLVNNGMMPMSALAGGLLPQCCPPVPPTNPAALAAMPGGPAGAAAVAAKIKADEAAAAAKVAALEYLGTVDCRHWKDAQAAILAALRGEPNECVRWAAARALMSGCCCSKKTIETLKIVVNGEETDGFPAELSPRVKGAAFAALQTCLSRVPEVVPEAAPVRPEGAPPAVRPEGPPPPTAARAGDPTHLAAAHTVTSPAPLSFDARLEQKPMSQVVEEARQVVIGAAQNPPKLRMLPTGKRSVMHALVKARQDAPAPIASAMPVAPPPPPDYYNPGFAPAPVADPNMNMSPVPAPAQMPAPAMPAPNPAIVPTAYVVPTGPAASTATAAPDPAPAGRRSLADVLLRSWNRGNPQ